MNRLECLEAASDAVSRRPDQYGPPEENFERIANLWRAHLTNKWGREVYLDATDVALMMALLKVARLECNPHHADSWVDLAGYAATGAEVADDLERAWSADWASNMNIHGKELV